MLTIKKHIDATIDYAVDFSQNLDDGETLSAPAVTVETASGGATTDITITNVQVSSGAVQFRVSGGKAHAQVSPDRWETRYCLHVQADTSSGETESEPVFLTTHECQQVT